MKPARGLPIDAAGGPTVDPTENVKDLMDASIKALTREADLQALLHDEKIKRMEREWIHLEAMATLREQHAKEARESEAKRIDAIRENDRSTVSATAAQSLAQIQALATAAATTAETLRNNTERTVSPILDRLTSIETTVNRGIGRATLGDPQMSEALTEMRKLTSSRDVGAGQSAGIDKTWALIAAIAGIVFLYLNYQRTPAPIVAAAPTPQVIYVPAPPAGTK